MFACWHFSLLFHDNLSIALWNKNMWLKSHIYINKLVFLWIYMHCNWRFYFIIVSNLVFILELYQIDIYFNILLEKN